MSDLSFLLFSERIPKIYLFSTFTVIEATLFTLYFFLTFSNKKFKRVIVVGYPIFLGIAAYSLIYRINDEFDSLPATVEAIFIILLSVLFFYEKMSNLEITFIYGTKDFWIIVALLLYLSATLFLFIATGILSSSQKALIWGITPISNIIKNTILAIAFSRPVTEPDNSSK